MDGDVLVAPIMVLGGFDVQDLYTTHQYYKEVPMVRNTTMCNFFSNIFVMVEWKLQGWVGGVA